MKAKSKPNGRDLFALDKVEWLEKARATARRQLERKETITAEDVVAECKLPVHLHRNVIGKIFQSQEFESVGYTLAKRVTSNGRILRLWALKNPPLPQKWVSRAEAVDTH